MFQSNYNKNSPTLRLSIRDQDYWPTDGWLTTSPEEQGMNSKILSKIYDYIEKEQVNIHSVIIVRNGYIIEEGYLTSYKLRAVNENYSKEMHELFSVIKSITSLCVGIALKMSYIDNLNQTFFEFFPELWKPSYDLRKKNITIENLLTMTSGIEWDESSIPYGNPGNDFTDMMSNYDWIQYYLDKPMKYDPGKIFTYSGGSSMLLSALVQKATNQTTSEFAHENLFTSLGISKDRWKWGLAPGEITIGASDLYMTPRDMAKIGLLCLNNGTWEEKMILSKNYIIAATGVQQILPSYYPYGYQFWILRHFTHKGYAATGYLGQRIFVFPDISLIIVFTSNLQNPNYYIDYIVQEFILASIGVDSGNSEYIISGYSLPVICSLITFGFLGCIYLMNKMREYI
ncbi:MAG: serine hydrolase domain-containing protein [Candidatus Thorarchaeota archaeon]